MFVVIVVHEFNYSNTKNRVEMYRYGSVANSRVRRKKSSRVVGHFSVLVYYPSPKMLIKKINSFLAIADLLVGLCV